MLHLDYPPSPTLCSFFSVDIILPSNKPQLILVGKSKTRQQISYSVIAIKTLPYSPLKQLIYFSEHNLNSQQLESFYSKTQTNKKESRVIKTQGLIGFIKFLQGYYLIYIEQAESIARIGKHRVKIIKKTNILPLFEFEQNQTKTHEKRYLQLLRSYKLQNYYFSNTYDLTNSLFWNMNNYKLDKEKYSGNIPTQPSFSHDKSMHGFCQIFQWNYNLIKEFNQEMGLRQWIVPIIHGFCRQMSIKTRGTSFNVIIVSRRSRHHAGTRYIKRGINEKGFVANFVQTEQIVVNCSSNFKFPNCSSFIQVRGSAPVYWMQQPNFVNPKPAIELVGSDPMFLATKKHFSDLIAHYGRHIFCINLMKTVENSPRQTKLSAEYSKAVTLINQQFQQIKDPNRIHYMETDYKANQKINKLVFMDKIKSLAYYCILKMGVNQCRTISRAKKQEIEFQNGVIRSNCVDCLDRTNSFQEIIGQTALSIQIAKLMNQEIDQKTLTIDMSIFENFAQIFEEMGDLISIQYGSSMAHKQEISKTQGARFEFMTSMTRHINNTFNDNQRQQQIDLFLKIEIPSDTLIWDLKPHITLFPSQTIREKTTKYWQRKAYNQFKKQIDLDYYQKISKHSINNQTILNKIIKHIQKHDLVRIWSNNIADEMYADFNEQYLFWIQIPSYNQIKHFTRKLKSKLSIRKNLEEKLNQQYDRYQRKSSKTYEALEIVVEPELTITITEPSQYFNSIIHNNNNQIPSPQLNPNTNKSIRIADEVFQVSSTYPEFNERQIVNSVTQYINLNVIDEQIIHNDLALTEQTLFDPALEIQSDNKVSEEQMTLIIQKINSMDFVSQNKIPREQGTTSPNERRERRRTLYVPVKHVTIEEKKTEVLGELITKHFSHGHKVGRIRII